MSDSSEEKSLPASDKKIRDARQKGQVVKSKDLVTGVALAASSIYLGWAIPAIGDRVQALLGAVAERAYTEPFEQVWPMALDLMRQVLLGVALPLLAITLAAVALTNLVVMRGFVFSVTPLTPNFKHVNPAEGVKRIYSIRGLIEFAKSLVKIAALLVAFVIVFRSHLQDLMMLSSCTASCQLAAFGAMVRPLMATALVAFIVVGLIDVLLQRWLFQRDMRMTRSESKRERRDMEGDPTILRQRRRQREEAHSQSSARGVAKATLLIGTPGLWTVGIRYVRGETPVPVVVSRAEPGEAAETIERARAAGFAVVRDDGLAQLIARTARTGEPVPRHAFQQVADLLVSAGMI